jgi:putative DNA primase/helicase
MVLPFEFDARASAPREWLAFLKKLWPNDPETIGTLQEWFGYLLTPDTRQQKILFLLGPKRSGKGTIARVLGELVGATNFAGPRSAVSLVHSEWNRCLVNRSPSFRMPG